MGSREHPAAIYRELGMRLRRLREAAGITGRQIWRNTGWDPARVSRIEAGKVRLEVSEVTWYLGLLRATQEEALPLVDMCRRAVEGNGYWLSTHDDWVPESLKSLIYHENNADVVASFEPVLVPGILQSADYARAVIGREDWRSEQEIEECVALRMERQKILDARPTARVMFIHEHALRTNVGGPEVMHEQMLALALACGAPGLSVRVLLAARGIESVFGNSFSFFDFDDHAPLVYLENFSSGMFVEERKCVESYRRLVPRVDEVALGVDESREFLISLADKYDRRDFDDVGQLN